MIVTSPIQVMDVMPQPGLEADTVVASSGGIGSLQFNVMSGGQVTERLSAPITWYSVE